MLNGALATSRITACKKLFLWCPKKSGLVRAPEKLFNNSAAIFCLKFFRYGVEY